MLLEHKNAVVYGGAGSVGRAVARAFAREGARVFLTGRTLATLDEVAEELSRAGGSVETAQVDALDEQAVDEHADAVAEKAGGIDVSFNAISHGDVHGVSLAEMSFEDFARPITTAMRTQFLTTRAAARHMTRQGSGVIMAITATTARLVIPEIGGTGVTFDAIESQCRQWACELGRHGVRVVWLQTTGLPEALADIEVFPGYGTGSGNGMTRTELIAWDAATHPPEPVDVPGRGRDRGGLCGLRPRRRHDRHRREHHLRPGPGEIGLRCPTWPRVDVHRLALALPQKVAESSRESLLAGGVKGKTFACERPLREQTSKRSATPRLRADPGFTQSLQNPCAIYSSLPYCPIPAAGCLEGRGAAWRWP